MKNIILAIISLLFIVVSIHAQEQQPPPQPLGDTISGWKVVFSNPLYGSGGRTISQLMFPTFDTGFAAAYNGTRGILLHSTDAGITWDSLETPPPLGYLAFTSGLNGYCTINDKIVYKTTDGGMSWVSYPRNSIGVGPMVFASKDTGMVLGAGEYSRTTDAGESWTKIFFPVGATKNDGSFANATDGYVVGDISEFVGHPEWPWAGSCLKTTDAGGSWVGLYTGIPHYLYCCYALDPKTVIVGGSACIFRTIDGGKTWKSVSDSIDGIGFAQNVSFANKSHGLIVGSDGNAVGRVYATTDSGLSWKKQYIPEMPLVYGVSMLSDSVAVICAGGNIYRTTNGGNAILSVPQHTIDFHVQTYPNPTIGSLSIQYHLPSSQAVTIAYYNTQGVQVGTAILGILPMGVHTAQFDGSLLPNGAYYFRLSTPTDFFIGSFRVNR